MTREEMDKLAKEIEELDAVLWGYTAAAAMLRAILKQYPPNSTEYEKIQFGLKGFSFILHKELDAEFKQYLRVWKALKELSKEQLTLLQDRKRSAAYETLTAVAKPYSRFSFENDKIVTALLGLAFIGSKNLDDEFEEWLRAGRRGPRPLTEKHHALLREFGLECSCCPPNSKLSETAPVQPS